MKEINLLPPSRRRRLRQGLIMEAIQRFLRHVQLSLLIMSAIGVVSIIWLQIAITVSAADAENQIPARILEYKKAYQSIIEKNNAARSVISVDQDHITWSDSLFELLGTLPPGTHVNSITIGSPPMTARISGSAVNRNALNILKGRLEQLSWAQSVTAPLENLLVRDRPTFTYTIRAKTSQSSPESTTNN